MKDRIGIREFLGLSHFTAHDLRRTAATIARRAGAPREFARAEKLTFDQLADKYIAEYAIGGPTGIKAVEAWRKTGKWPAVAKPNKSSWKNDVGALPANSITEDDAADLLDEIAKTAPVGANRTQSILHTLFQWAKQPGTKARKLVTSNPIADLSQRGGKEKKRDRVLTDDEIKTLWWGLDREDLPADRQTALALKFILTNHGPPVPVGIRRGQRASRPRRHESGISLAAASREAPAAGHCAVIRARL